MLTRVPKRRLDEAMRELELILLCRDRYLIRELLMHNDKIARPATCESTHESNPVPTLILSGLILHIVDSNISLR